MCFPKSEIKFLKIYNYSCVVNGVYKSQPMHLFLLQWLLYKNIIINIVSLPLSLQSKMKYNKNAVSLPQNFFNLEMAILANK